MKLHHTKYKEMSRAIYYSCLGLLIIQVLAWSYSFLFIGGFIWKN